MTSYDAIAIFVQVARSGSFSEAANVLKTPLSTVSRKVAELETSLSTQLIDRSTRQIRLTNSGSKYFEICSKGLDTLAFANRAIKDLHTNTAGTLIITVPPNLVEVLFLEITKKFQIRYPQARVRILVSERMLDFVDDAIDLSFRVAAPTQPDLVSKTMLRYRHRLVASPSYVAGSPLPREPEELANHRLLGFGFNTTREVEWSISMGKRNEVLCFEPNLAINDYTALRSALLVGHGIGELPEPLCEDLLQAGELIEVLPKWRLPEIRLYAVHPGQVSMTKLARLFLDSFSLQMQTHRHH